MNIGGYEIVHGLFTPEEIAEIFERVKDQGFKRGSTGGEYHERRTSLVSWIRGRTWISERMYGAAKAVAARYDLELTSHEFPQIAAYSPEMKFDWHRDAGQDEYKHRKLSGVVELQSAPGGRLEIKDAPPIILEPGDACFFQSGLWHRATAPRELHRFSMTMWFGLPKGEK